MSENSVPAPANLPNGSPEWVQMVTVLLGGLLSVGIKTLADSKLITNGKLALNKGTEVPRNSYIYSCAPDTPPDVKDAFEAGRQAGFAQCEDEVRMALNGHRDSELWGDHGLLAANMRCVEAVSKIEDVMWGSLRGRTQNLQETVAKELQAVITKHD